MLRNNGRHNFRSPFGIQPSLNLPFATDRTLDSRITFTRSSNGAYYNASGFLTTASSNVPRFGYDPLTLASLGLLVEQSSTNLQTYSLLATNWTTFQSTLVTSATTSPDGISNAVKIVESVANNTHQLYGPNPTISGSTVYTYSVYAKAAERTFLALQINESPVVVASWVSFNLSNNSVGTVTALAGGGLASASATATAVGNGWYRCTLTWTSNVLNNSCQAYIGPALNATTRSYTGDATKGVYAYQAQAEPLPFASSPIVTTTAQVTRAADNASMTGTNFSSWYNIAQGTFYTEFPDSGLNPWAVPLSIGSQYYFRQTASNSFSSVLGGTSLAFTTTLPSKMAGSYNGVTTTLSVNGITAQTGTGTPISNANSLSIGNYNDSAFYQNGHIKKIAYYSTNLTSSQLQALTT
jgi:hypothetical protein